LPNYRQQLIAHSSELADLRDIGVQIEGFSKKDEWGA
jgi:hypothetical protein